MEASDSNKTKQYYASLSSDDLCQCKYCRAYMKGIRDAAPEAADLLETLGADIEKPFEVLPLYEDGPAMVYSGAQYIVFGKKEDFTERSDGVFSLFVTEDHPPFGSDEGYYVIELRFKGLITCFNE